MYLKNLDTSSTSDAKNSDIVAWVDQAYKMLKHQKVNCILAVRYILCLLLTFLLPVSRMILRRVSSRRRSCRAYEMDGATITFVFSSQCLSWYYKIENIFPLAKIQFCILNYFRGWSSEDGETDYTCVLIYRKRKTTNIKSIIDFKPKGFFWLM